MPSSPVPSTSPKGVHHDCLHNSEGRRGRQARPSLLSQNMTAATRKFCRAVGAPNVVPPAGFRDFRGWLIRLNSKEYHPLWDELIGMLAKDVGCSLDSLHALKEDVVRDIVKCVVIPRPDESVKLVSTNAGRQASRPRSGTTLIIVLDQQISRVENNLPQLVSELSRSRPLSSERTEEHCGALWSSELSSGLNESQGWSNRQNSTPQISQRDSYALPTVQDLVIDNQRLSRPLPSFRELDASIKKSRSTRSSPSGR